MRTAERIVNLLEASSGRELCAGCVARRLALPPKRAHQAMLKIELLGDFHRHFGDCSECGKVRLLLGTPGAAVKETDR